MTKKELVDTYLKHIRHHRIKGGDDDMSPVLPFLMLDAMLEVYRRDISKLPVKRAAKMYRNKWMEAYTAFNRDFFSAFTLDEQDEIIDMMDSFWEHIEHDILIAKIALMEHVNYLPLEQQDAIAATMLCSIIIQDAQIVWEKVYSFGGIKRSNKYISLMHKNCQNFAQYLPRDDRKHVDFNESKRIELSVDILGRKMVEWMLI